MRRSFRDGCSATRNLSLAGDSLRDCGWTDRKFNDFRTGVFPRGRHDPNYRQTCFRQSASGDHPADHATKAADGADAAAAEKRLAESEKFLASDRLEGRTRDRRH